jgi:hypothetical protein
MLEIVKESEDLKRKVEKIKARFDNGQRRYFPFRSLDFR